MEVRFLAPLCRTAKSLWAVLVLQREAVGWERLVASLRLRSESRRAGMARFAKEKTQPYICRSFRRCSASSLLFLWCALKGLTQPKLLLQDGTLLLYMTIAARRFFFFLNNWKTVHAVRLGGMAGEEDGTYGDV